MTDRTPSQIIIRRELLYYPEARNSDGSEMPAIQSVSVQLFSPDGEIASPVFRYDTVEAAEASCVRWQTRWPGIVIEHEDTRSLTRQLYRRRGIEIPEAQ